MKRLGDLEEFKFLHRFSRKVLGRIEDPILRAEKAHDYVENYTHEVLANDIVKKTLACRNGCSACCHTQVSVTSDEAELLSSLVIDEGVEVDLKKLYIQGNVENNPEAWFSLPYEVRGCVFLDEAGSCRIYEDRPMVCRTNNVLESNEGCQTRDGVEKPVRLLNTHKADIVTMSAYEVAGEGGTLPHLLWKKLRANVERKNKKQKKKVLKRDKLKRVRNNISKLLTL